jgi:hypothetical protein
VCRGTPVEIRWVTEGVNVLAFFHETEDFIAVFTEDLYLDTVLSLLNITRPLTLNFRRANFNIILLYTCKVEIRVNLYP